MFRRILAVSALIALAACSGGSTVPASQTTLGLATSPPAGGSAASTSAGPITATQFVFGPLAASTAASARRPQYVTAGVQSVTIKLTSVNGTPFTAASGTATNNVNLATCPCTIAGPSVPAGSDGFTLNAYDGQNGSGNIISTASPTLTIVAGQTNSEMITLNGVPASFTISPPAAAAGTAFGGPQPVSVTVKDADGHTIMGAYTTPVSLADADTSGATTLTTSGSDNPAAGKLLSSGDSATLAYSGLAIAPVAITAAANGATNGSGDFAPVLQPIATTLTGMSPLIPLSRYATSATFTASEPGWTNAPYGKTLTITPAPACSTVGAVTPGSGTAFTANSAMGAVQGSCTVTISDFSGGNTLLVALDYTTGSQTFAYTGSPQAYSLPATITAAQIVATGAGGGSQGGATGAVGAIVTAIVPISSPAVTVTVGGIGASIGSVSGAGGAGGYPNGGAGGTGAEFAAAGGGGSTTVSAASTTLVIAGAGGGAAVYLPAGSSGYGGTPNGGAGLANTSGNAAGGGGGATQSGPGAGGTAGTNGASAAGSPGVGGTGGAGGTTTSSNAVAGGGGGGGYFGGGGGGDNFNFYGGNGGGGSSYVITGASGVTYANASSPAAGSVTISW